MVNFTPTGDFPMNHSTSSSKPVTKAISGFLYFKSAEGLSDRTLDLFNRTLYLHYPYLFLCLGQ